MLTCPKTQRQEQAQESRQKLMDAALTLFSANGYAGTNTRAICRSAGVAVGLLYHYFPGGKQELLQEIVREKFLEIEQRSHPWDTDFTTLPLEEALDRAFTATAAVFEENLALFRLVVREEEAHSVLQFGPLCQMVLGKQQCLTALLEPKVARGELPALDIECASDLLFSMLLHYFLGRLTKPEEDPCSAEAQFRKLLRYQCRLLCGAGPRQVKERSETEA